MNDTDNHNKKKGTKGRKSFFGVSIDGSVFIELVALLAELFTIG